MWCVAAALAPRKNWGIRWWAAILSLSLVALQVFTLTIVILESSIPSCGAHTDCAIGTFCNAWNPTTPAPRCYDCIMMLENPSLNSTVCAPTIDGRLDFEWDDVDHMATFFSKHSDYAENGFSLAEGCLAWKHCTETDKFLERCDHIVLKENRLHPSAMLIFFFVSLFMALPLIQDMNEAAVEEALLDHELALKSDVQPLSMFVAVMFVRTSLRIRYGVLPYITTTTVVAVIVASNFSMSDIVLNVLTVSFILEADNVISMVFMRPEAHWRADALIEKAVSPVALPWLETRWRALLCATGIAMIGVSIDHLIGAFGASFHAMGITSTTGSTCTNVFVVHFSMPIIFSMLAAYVGRPFYAWLRRSSNPAISTARAWSHNSLAQNVWLSTIGLLTGFTLQAWAIALVFSRSAPGRAIAILLTALTTACIAVDVMVRSRCGKRMHVEESTDVVAAPALAVESREDKPDLLVRASSLEELTVSHQGIRMPRSFTPRAPRVSSAVRWAPRPMGPSRDQTGTNDGVGDDMTSCLRAEVMELITTMREEANALKAENKLLHEKIAELKTASLEEMGALRADIASLKDSMREGYQEEVRAINVTLKVSDGLTQRGV